MAKFVKMCEGGKSIDIKKLAYHLCYLDKVIHNNRREREIFVKSLNSTNSECLDIYKNTGLCPEVYIRKHDKNKDTKISTALVHTGAETNILSL